MFIRSTTLFRSLGPASTVRFRARRGAGDNPGGILTVVARVSAGIVAVALLLTQAPALVPAAAFAQGAGIRIDPWRDPLVQPGRRPPSPYAPYETPPSVGPSAPRGMDADGAVDMLRSRGFSKISVLRQRGAIIILEANGPRGERVQLMVDGGTGAIAGMRVIGFGDKRY